ncbi:hypothetical protein Trydic_g5452 [Trypoxylus dichotomus]
MSQELNSVENYSEEAHENPNHNVAYNQNDETSSAIYNNEHYHPEYLPAYPVEHDDPRYFGYPSVEYGTELQYSEYSSPYSVSDNCTSQQSKFSLIQRPKDAIVTLLRPYIAEKYFPERIYRHCTPISTCAGTKTSQYKANVSLLEELNIPDSFEFILFPFYDYFDVILGLRDLKRLGLTIDTKRQTLRRNSLEIPFFCRIDFETRKIEIAPTSSIIKNIQTLYPEGTEIMVNDINNDRFHQIEFHPSSTFETALSVENGHYEFTRMPFGLKNAFQRVMDDILNDSEIKYV